MKTLSISDALLDYAACTREQPDKSWVIIRTEDGQFTVEEKISSFARFWMELFDAKKNGYYTKKQADKSVVAEAIRKEVIIDNVKRKEYKDLQFALDILKSKKVISLPANFWRMQGPARSNARAELQKQCIPIITPGQRLYEGEAARAFCGIIMLNRNPLLPNTFHQFQFELRTSLKAQNKGKIVRFHSDPQKKQILAEVVYGKSKIQIEVDYNRKVTFKAMEAA